MGRLTLDARAGGGEADDSRQLNILWGDQIICWPVIVSLARPLGLCGHSIVASLLYAFDSSVLSK